MKFSSEPKDMHLAGWQELRDWLNATCSSSGKFEFEVSDDGLKASISKTAIPTAPATVEYAPDVKRLRYYTTVTGRNEMHVRKQPLKPVEFETPYHQVFTTQQFGEQLFHWLEESRF